MTEKPKPKPEPKSEPEPKPKKHRRRQKLKKQVTVRIDEDLLKACVARAEGEGLRLTDAVETGLWLYLQRSREPEHVLRGRFLWSHLPMRLQKLTLGFWAFISYPSQQKSGEAMRRIIDEFISGYLEDPEYAPNLARLAEAGTENTPSENSSSTAII